ncbi:LPS export ABC transporter periplasmic protein LptC [bacterium]|nr:LPS export ABC transporter periplasmic protein LptC [bacterium]
MIKYILGFSLILFSCGANEEELLESRLSLPDQESWGVKILLTKEGDLRAHIVSGHLEKYNEKEFILLENDVKVDFFDNNENHSSVITSDKAEVDQVSNDMKAIGNVVAIADSGITLYSKTLTYNSKKEKLYTKESIMITTYDSDTLYGVGFESDSDLKNWHILDPSGVTNRGVK